MAWGRRRMAEEGNTGAEVVLSRLLIRLRSGVEVLKLASAGLCMRRAWVAKLRDDPECDGDECCCLLLVEGLSSDMRRYACFSHRLFHAMSSLTNSCHRFDTCDERASVLASSMNVSIYGRVSI
jgi:hypothetical protein